MNPYGRDWRIKVKIAVSKSAQINALTVENLRNYLGKKGFESDKMELPEVEVGV